MYESISKNNELENEMTLDMSYFWYSDDPIKTVRTELAKNDKRDFFSANMPFAREKWHKLDLSHCMENYKQG